MEKDKASLLSSYADDPDMMATIVKGYDKKIAAASKKYGVSTEGMLKEKADKIAKAKQAEIDKFKDVKPGKINITDKDNKKYYDEKFDEYAEFFSKKYSQKELRQFAEDEYPQLLSSLNVWQISTNKPEAMALRIKAVQVEGRKQGDLLWTMDTGIKKEAEERAKEIADSEYLNMRAMNQAYMSVNKQDAFEFFRGTDGRTGEAIAKDLLENKPKKAIFRDRIIGGVSDDVRVADSFGERMRGLTVRKLVPKEDVIVHKNLLRGLTRRHEREQEYIVFSDISAEFDAKDIKINKSDFGKEL